MIYPSYKKSILISHFTFWELVMEIFKIKVNVFIEAAGDISLHICLKEFFFKDWSSVNIFELLKDKFTCK